MKRLSIIVPMYNVAPYLERCIGSLEEQDIPKDEYEIICINDGSPDNCQEIIENLQRKYPNIILITQENQGVSRARNNGMDRATGKYLLFIDPDDFIDTNSFSSILGTAEEHNALVSFLGFTFLNVNGSKKKEVFYEQYKGKVYLGTEAYLMAREDGYTDPDRMVAVLFEKEFINRYNLRYLPDMPYLEDGEFIARIMCLATRCIFDGHSFYQRTTRPGSATNSNLFHSDRATNGFLLAARNLKRFQIDPNLDEKQRIFLNRPIAKFVMLPLLAVETFDQLKFFKKVLVLNNLRKLDLAGVSGFYSNFGKLYNYSFYIFFYCWKIKKLKLKLRLLFGIK